MSYPFELSTAMYEREKLADVSDGKDSIFITMDRKVWLSYAEQAKELEKQLTVFRIRDELFHMAFSYSGSITDFLEHLKNAAKEIAAVYD